MINDHNVFLVIISIFIAILASYSALSIAAKMTNASNKRKYFWLVSGSIVMGAGVWSMHFVGMIAHHSHASVRYDGWLTLLSMSASVISAFIAFYLTMSRTLKWYHLLIGGIVMGTGITLMHYIGMEAMVMDGHMTYDSPLVILSIVIALGASYAALFLFVQFKNQPQMSWLKWLAALVMGIAISGMHYTGMQATVFDIEDLHLSHQQGEIDLFLLVGVIVAIATILIISWASIFFDRYILEKMAYLDPITGLANRNEMTRFFHKQNPHKTMSLLFIDLDQFKSVNDTLGHDIGDQLLKKIGRLFKKYENPKINVFRIGGDEFLIVIDDKNQNKAVKVAKKLLNQIKQPFYMQGNELYSTLSIGIATGSIKNSDYSKLLRAADTAMYIAKHNGKNQYCIYTEEMGQQQRRKAELGNDIKQALEEEQFLLEYQPKWNVKSNRLVGFEALARWKHPQLGLIAPNEFIPIAEETGFIIPFTNWTLNEACKHCQILHQQGIDQAISVNLSPRLFQTNQLYEMIESALEKFKLDPKYLELEITESMMLHNIDDIVRQLSKIHTLGVKVSMDDFGTGYSSIGLLDTLPIDAVKLDRVFTKDIAKPTKQAVIQSIITLTDALGLDVIAEGVELEEDINYLTELGCYIMQGYYYSKPMRFDQINGWVKRKEENLLLA